MGNNTYLHVLAQGFAIVSLNGQRILFRNALHVLGLAVTLYSLRAHILSNTVVVSLVPTMLACSFTSHH